MNQLAKAVKGLQWELEVEKGEHRSTKELVLEVVDEVQVVDSPEGGAAAGEEAH